MEELIVPQKDELQVNMMNPLVWAYIGDSVYELYVRNYLINNSNAKVHELHVNAIKYVKARAQAEILKTIENILNEEEKNIVRRTRNTQNHHIPKNADPSDYMYATAFEGLIGYLYLNKRFDRLKEILNLIEKEYFKK